MSEIRSHRDLIAWQKSMHLSLAIYEISKSFPSDERFGLTSQLRRAGVSVPSNIAEGYGRQSTSDYLRFLRIARGSLYEIDTQLLLCPKLGYVSKERFTEIEAQGLECGRLIGGLLRSIEETRT